MNKYILEKDGSVFLEKDTLKWDKWFESANRVVAQDKIDNSEISTVFLGLDHGFCEGPPVLWETMIFGGKHDGYQDRYSSLKDAKKGHERAVTLVQDDQNSD